MKKKLLSLVLFFIIACTCGVVFIQKADDSANAEPQIPSVSIYACNLSFQDNVYILYAVDTQNIDDTSKVKLLVWTERQNAYIKGQESYSLPYIRQENIGGKNCLVFENNRLSAKQMTDTLYAVAYYDNGGGGVYSSVVEYSILQYSYNKLNNQGTAQSLKDLLSSMLEYGTMAQKYFGYHTERLANATYYEVYVSNGSFADGSDHALMQSGENREVIANAPQDGYKFVNWTDGSNNVISTEMNFTFNASYATTITANYKKIEQQDKVYTALRSESPDGYGADILFIPVEDFDIHYVKLAVKVDKYSDDNYSTEIGYVSSLWADNAINTVKYLVRYEDITDDYMTIEFETSGMSAQTVKYNTQASEVVVPYERYIAVYVGRLKNSDITTYKILEVGEGSSQALRTLNSNDGYGSDFIIIPVEKPGEYTISMDLKINKTSNQWGSTSFLNVLTTWVDNTPNQAKLLLSYDDIVDNEYMNVSFVVSTTNVKQFRHSANSALITASCENFILLRTNFVNSSVETTRYKNLVFKWETSLANRNLQSNNYGFDFIEIPVEKFGTYNVEMDVMVNKYSDTWVKTSIDYVTGISSSNAINSTVSIAGYNDITDKGYIHISFTAPSVNFKQYRYSSSASNVTASNSYYVLIKIGEIRNTSDATKYKNVKINGKSIEEQTSDTVRSVNSDGYGADIFVIPTDCAVGETVSVSFDVKADKFKDQYSSASIGYLTSATQNGYIDGVVTLIENADITGDFMHVECNVPVLSLTKLAYDDSSNFIDACLTNEVVIVVKGVKDGACATSEIKNINITVPPVITNFVSNGVSLDKYKIVRSSNATSAEVNAANELASYINKATGYTLEVVSDIEPEQENEIEVGNTNRNVCKQIDYVSLGKEGYKFYTSGNKLVLAGNDRGALYSVYSFLEKLGYRFYAEGCEKIPSSKDVFVPMSINEQYIPPIEFRDTMFGQSLSAETWNAKQKVNSAFARNPSDTWGSAIGYVGGNKGLVHTFENLLPWSTYGASHPEYYSSYYSSFNAGANHQYDQPCLTNQQVLNIVITNAKSWLLHNSTGKYLSISENDSSNRCQCANCRASYEKYGYSGTLLKFVNAVANEIKYDYPDIKVEHLVYTDKSLPKGGVVPADNVVIRLCTDGCQNHSFSERCTEPTHSWDGSLGGRASFVDVFEGWSSFGNPVMIWYYAYNYNKCPFFIPNLHIYYDNITYLYNNGARGIYCEGIGQRYGEFGELRCYLLAKLMWNPNMTKEEYEYHMNDFLQGYYGDGWEAIKAYITYTESLLRDTDHFGSSDLIKNIYPISQNYTENKKYIENCENLWEIAEKATVGSQREHVKKSRLAFTLYKLYTTMERDMYLGDSTVDAKLTAECQQLYNDMVKYGVTQLVGNEVLGNVTNFAISPWYWFYGNSSLNVDTMPVSSDIIGNGYGREAGMPDFVIDPHQSSSNFNNFDIAELWGHFFD